jgi:hypothetical protein
VTPKVGQLIDPIQELQAEVSDLRRAVELLQRKESQSVDRNTGDALDTNAVKEINSKCDLATTLPDGTPFRNIKSGITHSHRSWAEPGDEVVLRAPTTNARQRQ